MRAYEPGERWSSELDVVYAADNEAIADCGVSGQSEPIDDARARLIADAS